MLATYTPATGPAYDHDGQQVLITAYKADYLYDDQVRPIGAYLGWTQSCTYQFTVRAQTQAELKTKIGLAEEAYGRRPYSGSLYRSAMGGQLEFKHADGTTVANHALYPGDTGGATRIRSFEWISSAGVEYAVQRTAQVTMTNGVLIREQGGQGSGPGTVAFVIGAIPLSGIVDLGQASVSEEYQVTPRQPVHRAIAMPTGPAYVYEESAQGILQEQHTIQISSPQAHYTGAVASPIAAPYRITRRYGRTNGVPVRYATTITITKES